MNPFQAGQLNLTRREFFGRGASGIGIAALASLLGRGRLVSAAPSGSSIPGSIPGLPDFPQVAPRAKRVIYLFQNGAPTHVDLFDYKPQLLAQHGKPIPDSYIGAKRFSTMTGKADGKLLLGPIEPFRQHGESGAWVSALMPHVAEIADELCFVKGMHTDAINHAPAISLMLSGGQIPGRASLGAWLAYGLGCETDSLPSFVVMTSVSKGTSCGQIFYDFYWTSGFLPSRFQGVKFRGSLDPVLYLNNPDGVSRGMRRRRVSNTRSMAPVRSPNASRGSISVPTASFERSAVRLPSSNRQPAATQWK